MNWWNEEQEKTEFELLPDGEYVATFDHVELDTTKDPRVMTVRYKVHDNKFGGRKLWQRFRFNDKSGKFLSWQMGVIGVQSEAKLANTLEEYSEKCLDGVGELVKRDESVLLKVSQREYNGKIYQDLVIKDPFVGELPKKNHALTATNPPKMDDGEELPF